MKMRNWKGLGTSVMTTTVLLAVPALALTCFGGNAWHALDGEFPEQIDLVVATAEDDAERAESQLAEADLLDEWQDTGLVSGARIRLFRSALKRENALKTTIGKLILQRSRMSANEASASGALKTIALKLQVLGAELNSVHKIRLLIEAGRLTRNAAVARLNLFDRRTTQTNARLQTFITQTNNGTASASTFKFSATF